MLRIAPTRSGSPTLYCNERSVHSTYDPLREADRFVRENLRGMRPDCVVVLGPGLGYIVNAVRERFPDARPVSLHLSEEVFQLATAKPQAAWHPGSSEALATFLDKHIKEFDLEGLRVLEWLPCIRSFPEQYRQIVMVFDQHVRELRGSVATTSAMGRTWVRNSLHNFLGIDAIIRSVPVCSNRPTLIVASGPSLDGLVPTIREAAERMNLWALPSAVSFLLTSGILPDAVVLTDPGYYAMAHLHPARGMDIPLIIPLSAATGAWKLTGRIQLISQGTFHETGLLSACGLRLQTLPALGTVAASAMMLAQMLVGGEVYFCGLDFCYRDILSHAKPSVFDTLLRLQEDRLRPHYGLSFEAAMTRAPTRINGSRTCLPLQTYAGWFRRCGEGAVRCNPSDMEVPGMRTMQAQEFRRKVLTRWTTPKESPDPQREAYPDLRRRRAIARRLIHTWRTVLGEAMVRIDAARTAEPLFEDPRATRLCYYLDLPSLMRLKSNLRCADRKEALAAARTLLNKSSSFLERLLRMVG